MPPPAKSGGPFATFMRSTEIDPRLLGMVGALLLIWVGFHLYSALFLGGGTFLTPRNLWNLSVQTASIGIMATGMVLVIITRNIDLSVGSLVGVTGMVMGILQVEMMPAYLGIGHPAIWITAALVGIATGALIGAFHGWLSAYRDIPSFIVTLGGLMIWRSAAFLVANGKTISPVDETFALAARYNCDIDYHLDNWDSADAFSLPYVAQKTIAQGWQGRVAVSHIASLAHVSHDRCQHLLLTA